MADIFISYASADREIARTLGQTLSAKGYDAWWDRTIPPGRVFDEVIQEALTAAKCVIMLWSQASIASNWVKTEAADAAGRNILVPVMVESVLSPIEFKRIQSANLAAWNGDQNDPEFSNLLASVDRLLAITQKTAAPGMRKDAANTGWGKQPGQPKSSGLYKWSAVAAVVLVLMGAAALWAYRLGLNAGKSAPTDLIGSRELVAATPREPPSFASAPESVEKVSPPRAATSDSNAAALGKRVDILSNENGGHVVAATSDAWSHLIDGKEKDYAWLAMGESGVDAFKDERRATFDTFTVLIPASSENNVKAFELLKGGACRREWTSRPSRNVKLVSDVWQRAAAKISHHWLLT